MRALIADDDPVYQELLRNLLSQWEYDVVVACDGNEAWEALQTDDPPKLAIIDWMMPGLDGFELCRRIRQSPQGDGLYVLFLTGGSRKKEIIRALVAGVDDYLIKPFEPLDLKTRLLVARRILDLRQEVAELRDSLAAQSHRGERSGAANPLHVLD